jgi:hypothetical protein
MSVRAKKQHPALKHGGYSAASILPGENAAEFEKLHQNLIAELDPNGALEDDIVASIARLLWRKQNLSTFRIAEVARERWRIIANERVLPFDLLDCDSAARKERIEAANNQVRKEFGEDISELVKIGEIATVDSLMQDLEVQDRLDAVIDRCLKRLLFLRGLKSISGPSSSAPPKSLAGPSKAA